MIHIKTHSTQDALQKTQSIKSKYRSQREMAQLWLLSEDQVQFSAPNSVCNSSSRVRHSSYSITLHPLLASVSTAHTKDIGKTPIHVFLFCFVFKAKYRQSLTLGKMGIHQTYLWCLLSLTSENSLADLSAGSNFMNPLDDTTNIFPDSLST